MLGPEILAVFANSQIFQDHQPTKLNRINTKLNMAGIHSPKREIPTTPKESDQDRLLRRLEGNNESTPFLTKRLTDLNDLHDSGTTTPLIKVKFYLD